MFVALVLLSFNFDLVREELLSVCVAASLRSPYGLSSSSSLEVLSLGMVHGDWSEGLGFYSSFFSSAVCSGFGSLVASSARL